MNFVTLGRYSKDGGLTVLKNDGRSNMYLLGYYLTDDVSLFADSWKKWILDDSQIETCSNFTYQDKEDDGTIMIGFLLSDDFEPHILVKKEQLLGLLDAWDKCIKERAAELTIYQEGDDIRWKIVPQRGKIGTFLLSLWSRIKKWLCV